MTVQADTPHKVLSRKEQAVYHHARTRTRSFRNPTKDLTRTHRFAISEVTVLSGLVFPSRTRPITFSTTIEVTGVTATGLIFEFGSSTTGIKLAIDSGTILFAAGDSAVGDGGINGSVAIPALAVIGSILNIVVAISPGHGQARIWVNGELVARIQNDPIVKLTNDNWSDTGSGSIGAIQNGTSNTRVAITAAPSDFIFVERLSAFVGQLPRQFHHGLPMIVNHPPNHAALPTTLSIVQNIATAIPLVVTDQDGDLLCVTVTVTNGILSN